MLTEDQKNQIQLFKNQFKRNPSEVKPYVAIAIIEESDRLKSIDIRSKLEETGDDNIFEVDYEYFRHLNRLFLKFCLQQNMLDGNDEINIYISSAGINNKLYSLAKNDVLDEILIELSEKEQRGLEKLKEKISFYELQKSHQVDKEVNNPTWIHKLKVGFGIINEKTTEFGNELTKNLKSLFPSKKVEKLDGSIKLYKRLHNRNHRINFFNHTLFRKEQILPKTDGATFKVNRKCLRDKKKKTSQQSSADKFKILDYALAESEKIARSLPARTNSYRQSYRQSDGSSYADEGINTSAVFSSDESSSSESVNESFTNTSKLSH